MIVNLTLFYYFVKSSRGATFSPDAERALAPHGLICAQTARDTNLICFVG
jgi:hypothetical protein